MSNFAYLHLHTSYSQGGGPAAPADWCRRAAELGYSAVGVSDRAPLAAFPTMYRRAKEAGLTPLFGLELDILLPPDGGRKAEPVTQPVLLYARSSTGAKNMALLASEAYAGWPGTERALAWDVLAAHSVGLVLIMPGGDEAGALSPFVGSSPKKLADLGRAFKASFPDAAFIGLPHAGRPGDNALADQVATAAAAMGIPPVALPTARYLLAEDAPSYEALKVARKRAGWPREDADTTLSTTSIAPDRPGHDYLRAPEEAAALFAQWPEAVANVATIIGMGTLCTEEWPLTADLQEEARTFLLGLAEKKPGSSPDAHALQQDMLLQLALEVDIATRRGREGAWVALSTIVDIAESGKLEGGPLPLGAPTGTARESALAYALGISPIEPATNQATPPVGSGAGPLPLPGLEVPVTRRDALVAGLSSEYGPGRLARAACALPLTPTQAVQAASSVLGVAGEDLRALALAAIEQGWDALAPGSEQQGNSARLAALAITLKAVPLTFRPDPDTFLAAPRQTHGTGTLAAYGPILAPANGEWMPWTEEEICELPYPAFSLHPTRALSALDSALAFAKRFPTPDFHADDANPATMPVLTEAAVALLRKGELAGIPYLSAAATKDWPAETTLDVVAECVARSLSPKHPPAPDPKPAHWDEITASTGGALLFKDQFAALLIGSGVSPHELLQVQRAMRNPGEGDSEQAKANFTQASGLGEVEADALWKALAAHAGVLLDRDVAAAHGRIALWMVAVKAGHPAAFLAGVMATTVGRTAITALAEEARRLGINIEAPHINRSEANPTLQRDGESWSIVWGLNHLPGWHDTVTTRFLAARPATGFNSLREVALAAVKAGLSAAHIETLVRSGACDSLGATVRDRDTLLDLLPAMFEWAYASHQTTQQNDLFTVATFEPPAEDDLRDSTQVTHSPRTRYVRRTWEQANIGMAFTQAGEMDALISALNKSGDLRTHLMTTAQVNAGHLESSINLVGLLSSIMMVQSSSATDKDPIAVAWLEDVEGSIELVAFPPNYKRHADLWLEGNLVVVTARVSKHQDGEIYLLSEHIVPFQAAAEEEAMTLTIKAPRKSAAKADDKSASATVPVPSKPAPQPIAAASGYTQPVGRQSSQPSYSSGEPATYSLIISIPPADDDHAVIDSMISLNELLTSNPGPDSVTIRVQYNPDAGNWTSARLPGGVRYSSRLENSIRRLLGDDALAVIKLLG
ncbi:MAG: PHP domain-containing protein [Chloroflexota bacterium]